ncbi:MAG: TonB-dependent receptor [Bacteroidales bacterium]|nr:TonB-dependent receptor [Bacteroidales bacterium]
MLNHRILWALFLLFSVNYLNEAVAQTTSGLYGNITDTTGNSIAFVNISIPALNKGTVSDERGRYRISLPAGSYDVVFSLISYKTEKRFITLSSSENKELNIKFISEARALSEVSVIHQTERNQDITRISIREFELLPNPAGSLESLIKTSPGVFSQNELSSQYSVRGGNFDENLVYVNDIEIVRPFLIRSGQQEGLSFINPDLVGSIRFSAGGFEARYGDKMSSVLDVTYRNPQKAASSVSVSLMGGSVSAEGISKNKNLSLITGVRYKTTRLLLGSLDSKGEYEPNFTDWQMLLNYKITDRFTVGMLTNYARNAYTFIPQTRNTNFGTYANIYNLKVYYDGREDDLYNSAMGALTLQYQFNADLRMKLMANTYSTYEQEKFDISGEYLINELDAYAGSDTYGDSLLNLGVGGMLNHARNYLQAEIRSVAYSGNWQLNNHLLSWSVRYQYDHFKDRMREWDYIDSAGYSSPYSERNIVLNSFASAENTLSTNRFSAYMQDAVKWENASAAFTFNAGLRFFYWSLNGEALLSPRIRFSVKPYWSRDVVFYAASGIYNQPPLFREMRNAAGELNKNIKSQRSYHFLVGSDLMLTLWDRPFKYTCEAYYKYLENLIPYKIDNVRIRYTAQNNAKGYAAGLDMKLYGEFVPGVESWASLSLLSTKENINDDYYLNNNGERIEPGYYHRPTDQLFHFNLFFQDYLPNNPSLRASLNLVYGSGFYIAPPKSSRFDATYPLGNYRRVDLGLSKTIKLSFWPVVKSFWIGAEVFNLFDISNKASFMWIQTVSNQENIPNVFAVPNYLTSRRLNLKMTMKF